jgi:hypothetical protein
MRLYIKSLKFKTAFLLIIILFVVFLSSASAQFARLIVKAGDTTAYVEQQNVYLPIYMQNWDDTVAAFMLTLTTSHPDVIDFHIGSFDTSGTLISGWQYVSTSSDNGNDLIVAAMANMIPPPHQQGIGYPQVGDIPLIKVLADINLLPDTMTTQTVEIIIKDNIYDFNFSDEAGNTIGLGYGDTIFDTSWYICTDWTYEPPMDSFCLNWEMVGGPPADSIAIDTNLTPFLDTSLVHIWNGSIILRSNCELMGDVDGNGIFNLLDITFLISYLYMDGPTPPRLTQADVNCSCNIDLMDITCMISSLYPIGWTCTFCTCEEWEANCGEK